MYEYPTDEDYAYAAKKGLSKPVVYNRWAKGWSVNRAINEPHRNNVLHERLKQEARANGIEISKAAIRSRLKLEWSEEKIVTSPVRKKRSANK